MANVLSSSESRIDVVSGISAGGINAAGLSIFPVGQEKEAADYLVGKWSTMQNDYVW
jgi:predicted acylesterase/phospholipase RssA